MFISFIGYADGKYQESCHTFEEEGWNSRPNMKYKRSQAAASMMAEGWMVTGGWDGSNDLSSTEIFSGGQWTDGPALSVQMAAHCQVTSRDGVIVAGKLI